MPSRRFQHVTVPHMLLGKRPDLLLGQDPGYDIKHDLLVIYPEGSCGTQVITPFPWIPALL
jgi:hypothetical protein